jgi:thiamine biosynthesis lipoprotein
MEALEFQSMGCQVSAIIDRDGLSVKDLLQSVPVWFEKWEQCFSRFRSDSELSRINMSPGKEIQVSSLMQKVLRSAQRAHRMSQGLVTPILLNSLELAGYDRSFDLLQSPGSWQPSHPRSTPSPSGRRHMFYFDHRKRKLILGGGVRLDLGGVAKGWSVDCTVKRLSRRGPCLVDAGGDIAVSGPMSDGEPWPIGVSDPFDPTQHIDQIFLDEGAVATSGKDRRRWYQDGSWRHHLIDPRTGKPAKTDVLRATVVGPNTQMAEMAAKMIVLSGSLQGIDWLDDHRRFAGLLVLDNGDILYSRTWRNYVWR